MKILVCAKVCNGALNPFDESALECALRLSDDVTVISMGPQSTKEILESLTRLGAKAVLISDKIYAGSDTLATSYILAEAIKKYEYDLILCGRQSIDGDTAQVGPALAELLGLSQLTSVTDAVLENGALRVKWARDDDSAVARVRLPCLLTFGKGEFELRFGTIKRRKAANHADIPVFTIADFPEIDRSRIGLEGSPTQVASTFCPPVSKECMRIDEGGAAASAAKLADILSQAHVI